MIHTQFSYESSTELQGIAFCALRHMLLKQTKTANSKVLEDTERSLLLEAEQCHLNLCVPQSGKPVLRIAANDEYSLFQQKCAFVQQLHSKTPKVAANLHWLGHVTDSPLPANFTFVRVRDVSPLGPAFLRMTLEAEDLSQHRDTSIHFRFVQPPEDKKASWPAVAPNGSILWPDDDGAPHKPVYTTRSINYSENTLIVDVFVHAGGHTTAWAQQLLDGNNERQIIGIVGPVGGGTLDTEKVLMAADETGFPAAARILENLPDHATGTVFLESERGVECEYPMTHPKGINVTWLTRSADISLTQAMLAALPNHPTSKIWFAGEREQARQIREAAKALGRDTGDLRISGFWSAKTS